MADAFVLRETVFETIWPSLERPVRIAFWGLNAGLAMMVVFSLFPGGFMQVRVVLSLVDQLYDSRQRLLSLAAAVAAQEKAMQESIIAAMKMDAEPGVDHKR